MDQCPNTHTPKPAEALHRVNSSRTYGSDRLFSYRVQSRGKMTKIHHLASANPCTNLEAAVQSPNPRRPPRRYLVRTLPTLLCGFTFYTGRDELSDELFGKFLLYCSTASTIPGQPSDQIFFNSVNSLRVTIRCVPFLIVEKSLEVSRGLHCPVGFHVHWDCALHRYKREGQAEAIVLVLACHFS